MMKASDSRAAAQPYHVHHMHSRHQKGSAANGANSHHPASVPVATGDQLEAFDIFLNAEGLQDVMRAFHAMCDSVNLVPSCEDPRRFYQQLRQRFRSHWKANHLFEKLDKRAESKVYKLPSGSRRLRTLIVGAGPCGLRMAIEFAFLGCQTIVVEKRTYFSRKNVLYLWQFVTDDLVNLGAKHFCGQFCSGSISHSSIRTLQYILLKVALLLGVQVFCGVDFNGIVSPSEGNGPKENVGWRANINPADHMLSSYEFDVLIGADGRRNNMPGFQHESTRCKMAIAVTANFERTYDQEENQVEELNGRAFHFNQEYFHQIQEATGVLLENIVYYRDETNYFIMTPHKESLLKKGVLKENFGRSEELLHPSNIDQAALEAMVREVANFCTRYQLESRLVFSQNHHHNNDVSIFDFTTVKRSRNACRVIRRNGYQLFMALVGDSLSEPFWPLGTGCAHGFLSVLDTAWAVRNLAVPQANLVEVLHERECLYTLLKAAHLKDKRTKYTIDPTTRYKESYRNAVPLSLARALVDTDEPLSVVSPTNVVPPTPQTPAATPTVASNAARKRPRNSVEQQPLSPSGSQNTPSLTGSNPAINGGGSSAATGHQLLLLCYNWFHTRLSWYSEIVHIHDLCQSWLDGKALLCLVHCFKPHLVDLKAIKEDPLENLRLALGLLQKHFDVAPVLSAEEMLLVPPDRVSILYYLQSLYNEMKHLEPARANHPEPKIQSRQDRMQQNQAHALPSSHSQQQHASSSVGFLKSLMGGSRILRRSTGDEVPSVVQKGSLKKHREHLIQKLKENEDPYRLSQDVEEVSNVKKRPGNFKKEKSVGRVSVSAAVRNLFSGGGAGSSKEGTPQPTGSVPAGAATAAGGAPLSSLFSPGRQCRICKQVGILLVERAVLQDGSVVHRDCLRCAQCNVLLEPHQCYLYIGLNSRLVNNETTTMEIRCVEHFVPDTPESTVRYSPTLKRLYNNSRRRPMAENRKSDITDLATSKKYQHKAAVDLPQPTTTSSIQPPENDNVSLARSSSCGRRVVQTALLDSPRHFHGDMSLAEKKANKLSSSVEVLFEVTENGDHERDATECLPLPCHAASEWENFPETCFSVNEIPPIPGWQRPTQEWADQLLRERQTFWSRSESNFSLESGSGLEDDEKANVAVEQRQLRWFRELELIRQPVVDAYFASSEVSGEDVGKPHSEDFSAVLNNCQSIRAHRLAGNAAGSRRRNKSTRKAWVRKVREEKLAGRRGSYTPSVASEASECSSQSTLGVPEDSGQGPCCCCSVMSTSSSSCCSEILDNQQPRGNEAELLTKKTKAQVDIMPEEKLDFNKNSASPLLIDNKEEETRVKPQFDVVMKKDIHGQPPSMVNMSSAKTLLPFSLSNYTERGGSLPPYQRPSASATGHQSSSAVTPNDDRATPPGMQSQQASSGEPYKSAAARRLQFMMQPAKPVSIDSKGFIAEMNRNRAQVVTLHDPREEIGSGDDFCERALFPMPALSLIKFHDAVECHDLRGRNDATVVSNVSKDYDPRYLLRPMSKKLRDGEILNLMMDIGKGDSFGVRRQRSSSISSITTAAAFNPSSFFGLDDMKDIDSMSIMTEFDLALPALHGTDGHTFSDLSKQQVFAAVHRLEESQRSVDVTPQHRVATVTNVPTTHSDASSHAAPPAPLPSRKHMALSPDTEGLTSASIVVNIPKKASIDENLLVSDEEDMKTETELTPQESEDEGNKPLYRVTLLPATNMGTSQQTANAAVPKLAEFSEGDNLSDSNYNLADECLELPTTEVASECQQQAIVSVSASVAAVQPTTVESVAVAVAVDNTASTNRPPQARQQRNIRFGTDAKEDKSSPPTAAYPREVEANVKLAKKKWSGPGSFFGFLKRNSRSHGNLSQSGKAKSRGKGSKEPEQDSQRTVVVPETGVSKRTPSTDALDEALMWRPRSSSDLQPSVENPVDDGAQQRKTPREFGSPDVFSSPQRRDREKRHNLSRPLSFAGGELGSVGDELCCYLDYSQTPPSGSESDLSSEPEDYLRIHEKVGSNPRTPPTGLVAPGSTKPLVKAQEIKRLRHTLRKSFRTLQAQVKANAEEETERASQDTESVPSEQARLEIAIKRQRQEEEATIMQRSQEILCEKEDIETLLQQFTELGKKLETRLRSREQQLGILDATQAFKDETSGHKPNALLNEWFEVVSKQKHLEQHLSELHIQSKEIELEHKQCLLLEEYRLRQLQTEKSAESRRRDRELLEEYIRLVEERDTLASLLSEQRQRIANEEQPLSGGTTSSTLSSSTPTNQCQSSLLSPHTHSYCAVSSSPLSSTTSDTNTPRLDTVAQCEH